MFHPSHYIHDFILYYTIKYFLQNNHPLICILTLQTFLHPWHYSFTLGTIPSSMALFLHPWHYSFIFGIIPSSLALFLHPWHYSFTHDTIPWHYSFTFGTIPSPLALTPPSSPQCRMGGLLAGSGAPTKHHLHLPPCATLRPLTPG